MPNHHQSPTPTIAISVPVLRHLTIQETAERYRVTTGTIRDWMRQGRIPFLRIGKPRGRSVVCFPEAQLQEFERSNFNASKVQSP